MNRKSQKAQIQFSRKLRNCQSPQLTRLSSQINDLKRKIATIQTKQAEKIERVVNKSSLMKSPPKSELKIKIKKQQPPKPIIKNQNEKEQVGIADQAESQILKRLELFQAEFQSHASRIHSFAKKLRCQLKELEEIILIALKEMKDGITQSVDKDINKFIKAMKRYERNQQRKQLDNIVTLKESINSRLRYNTLEIDAQLLRLQKQIVRAKQCLHTTAHIVQSLNKSQQYLLDRIQDSCSIRMSKQLSRDQLRSKQHLQLSKNSLHSPKQNTNSKNIIFHLQEQKRQYNSAKLLLKL